MGKAEKERKSRSMPPTYRQGSNGGPNRNETIAASAMMAGGIAPDRVAKHFDQRVMNEAMAGPNRSYSLGRIIAECCLAAGETAGIHLGTAAGLRGEGVWQLYNNARNQCNGSPRFAGGSFSTISLPGILSNVVNKTLLASYEDVPHVLRRISSRGQSSDFKPGFSYRLFLEGGKLKKVPASGKIEGTTLSEDKFERGIDTYGEMITLTRRMVINDDLGALMKIPEMFGVGAAETMLGDEEVSAIRTYLQSHGVIDFQITGAMPMKLEIRSVISIMRPLRSRRSTASSSSRCSAISIPRLPFAPMVFFAAVPSIASCGTATEISHEKPPCMRGRKSACRATACSIPFAFFRM